MIFNPAVRLLGGIPRLRMPWLTNVFHQADPAGCLAISFLGVLNNTASGVLAPWPCSRTPPYAPPVQQWLPPSGCTRQFASFPSSSLRVGLDSPLRPDSAHAFWTLPQFPLVGLGQACVDEKTKCLKYSTAPSSAKGNPILIVSRVSTTDGAQGAP